MFRMTELPHTWWSHWYFRGGSQKNCYVTKERKNPQATSPKWQTVTCEWINWRGYLKDFNYQRFFNLAVSLRSELWLQSHQWVYRSLVCVVCSEWKFKVYKLSFNYLQFTCYLDRSFKLSSTLGAEPYRDLSPSRALVSRQVAIW